MDEMETFVKNIESLMLEHGSSRISNSDLADVADIAVAMELTIMGVLSEEPPDLDLFREALAEFLRITWKLGYNKGKGEANDN